MNGKGKGVLLFLGFLELIRQLLLQVFQSVLDAHDAVLNIAAELINGSLILCFSFFILFQHPKEQINVQASSNSLLECNFDIILQAGVHRCNSLLSLAYLSKNGCLLTPPIS